MNASASIKPQEAFASNGVSSRLLSKKQTVRQELSLRLRNSQPFLSPSEVEDALLCLWTNKVDVKDKNEPCIGNVSCKNFREGPVSPTALVAILQRCAESEDLQDGIGIHANIYKWTLLRNDLVLGTALVNMYAKCGAVAKAQEVFDELPVRNVVSWTALLSGYVQHCCNKEALSCFDQMLQEGMSPNAVTVTSILKACGSIGASYEGQAIHAEIVKQGWLEKDIVLGTALLDMYVKCGAVNKAQEIFDALPRQNAVSWTALITGHIQEGHYKHAIFCFDQMQLAGISADVFMLACILRACGSAGTENKGQHIHFEIVRRGLLERDMVLGAALVDMYVKCLALSKAQELFDALPQHNAISWTALITGYVHEGHGQEAVSSFEQMQLGGLLPDAFMCACILKACGSIGFEKKGLQIHAEIVSQGLLNADHVVGNALIDMYAKCGTIVKAQEVFDELPTWDPVSWNALIAGYAQLGQASNVFSKFDIMIRQSAKPDFVTFAILLNTCSHTGLVMQAQKCFETMSIGCGLMPTSLHYACIVDLFGRAGHLGNALAVIKMMPFFVIQPMWHMVMAACQNWGNLKTGQAAFDCAVEVKEDAVTYILMSNIYVSAVMPE